MKIMTIIMEHKSKWGWSEEISMGMMRTGGSEQKQNILCMCVSVKIA
jgi:hypothetical protein